MQGRPTRRDLLGAVPAAVLGASAGGSVPTAAQREAPDLEQVGTLPANDLDSGDLFGTSVALGGDTAVVGASDDDVNGTESGSAYVFRRGECGWCRDAKLAPDDGDSWDWFGNSVDVSADGTTALVGADGDEDPNGKNAGAVYVFRRREGKWRRAARLTPDDGDPGDEFGVAVALDGDTAIVGANGDDTANGAVGGSAYLFGRTGDTWTQRTKIVPRNGDAGEWFGSAVALDGDTALIGAFEDDDGGRNAGSAYLFERTGDAWRQRATFSPGDSRDMFGSQLALDGDTALVGAWFDEDPNGETAGAVYVFERREGAWRRRTKIAPEDGDSKDNFGTAIALDGDTALIGADDDEDPNGWHAGSAYVFERRGGNWTQRTKLAAADGERDETFGTALALDGTTALVGAANEYPTSDRTGSVYVFDSDAGGDRNCGGGAMPGFGLGTGLVALGGGVLALRSWRPDDE